MGAAQIVFLVGLASLIVAMALRKNVMIPAILATFATALAYSGSVPNAIMSVFRATITSGTALFEIFIVIAAVTSMLAAMRAIGSDEVMVRPISRWMVNGRVAYIVLFVFTYLLSLFFWPTPALALIGAVLLPAAIKVGLPPLGAAVVLAISGQGMSIASDYVIGLAPSISASGAGVPADDIADRALVISLIVGVTAAVLAYFLTVRRRMRTDAVPGTDPIGGTVHPPGGVGGTPGGTSVGFSPSPDVAVSPTVTDVLDEELPGFEDDGTRITDRPTLTRAWAIGVPAAFLAVLAYMLVGRFTDLVPWEDGGGGAERFLLSRRVAGTEGFRRDRPGGDGSATGAPRRVRAHSRGPGDLRTHPARRNHRYTPVARPCGRGTGRGTHRNYLPHRNTRGRLLCRRSARRRRGDHEEPVQRIRRHQPRPHSAFPRHRFPALHRRRHRGVCRVESAERAVSRILGFARRRLRCHLQSNSPRRFGVRRRTELRHRDHGREARDVLDCRIVNGFSRRRAR
ncbi:possible permease [Rhodococcus jostii RHA1]|uniref:Possible permease n=1 Tax=Rhodococcus jostii (strain RHA1) TaxID=101510 RepID=Q0SBA9_RHOJR|nr:possible permease [Rhodococcus jostii RHA1]